jgi:hypothetical protein
MVQLAVGGPQAKHQRRSAYAVGDSDDDAVGRPLPLHLDPFVEPARQVAAVCAFGYYTLDRQQAEPFLGLGDVDSLLDELQARMHVRNELLECTSAFKEWGARQVGIAETKQVEHQEDGWSLERCCRGCPLRNRHSMLESAEVRTAQFIGKHDLAIEQGACREHLCSLDNLREPGRKVFDVTT